MLIDHGGGWRTQYCHMRQGSVRVRKGDRVRDRQRLGTIGLSGKTEFPHLHLSVRFRGKVRGYQGAFQQLGLITAISNFVYQ